MRHAILFSVLGLSLLVGCASPSADVASGGSALATCHDMPSTNASDPAAAVNHAVTPLGGAVTALTTEVALDSLPPAVKQSALQAIEEIRNRRFEGTDYVADLAGIYAVHTSCSDSTTIAYAVLGFGSGEPDYHDGMVYGLALDGRFISYEEDQG